MKKYLLIVLLIGVCFGQDLLVLKTGQRIKGEYYSINLFDVKFMQIGTKFPQDVPIERIDYVMLRDGSSIQMHKPPARPSGKITPEQLSKLTREWLAEQSKIKCEENSSKTVITIPLKDDLYGITEDIIETLEKECYKTKSNYPVLQSIVDMNIDLNQINDYHLRELGKKNNVDLIVFGYLYTVDVPFMYTADPSKLSAYDPKVDNTLIAGLKNDSFDAYGWIDILSDVLVGFERAKIQVQDDLIKKQYEKSAGTWLYCTIYTINANTGEKKYLFKNSVIRKL